KGHGGIVETEQGSAGVYKDEQGKTYTVSPTCTHLGCRLEWNPDEKSWDCPCHGSRFDYKGNLLDNPAQTDISE
ncbi:MAG: Rieske 2Fe-2S domain-containing protein, partial [Clostridiales bacterium]|nr:Rieske 2Fe-2S domain-containing protein [Clostridiales bacterium]